MRYLVAGGAGFIGSHLTEVLLNEGNEVLVVDNYYTGKRSNLKKHFGNSSLELLRHDVCHPLHVEVDYIINLACPASPISYQKDPVQTLKTSISGSINLLGLAKRLKIPALLASTSEIYGDPLEHPQTEGYWGNVNNLGPRSCYDEGKRVAETLFNDYRRLNNIDTKIIRIFNTYGPIMDRDDGRVVSNFITQAISNQNITIYGDGSQTRSFCYISDLVDGMLKMIKSGKEVSGPINIGNPTESTIREIAEKIIELTNSKSKIVYCMLPKDDPKRRKPDITKAKSILGWNPKVELEEGLLKTIEYFSA